MEKQKNWSVIRISVRNLVEFIFRSGDIDNRIGKGVQKEAMREGSRMHRKIQSRMGSDYRSEVFLKLELPQRIGTLPRSDSSGEAFGTECPNEDNLSCSVRSKGACITGCPNGYTLSCSVDSGSQHPVDAGFEPTEAEYAACPDECSPSQSEKSQETETAGYILAIEGRADGIFQDRVRVCTEGNYDFKDDTMPEAADMSGNIDDMKPHKDAEETSEIRYIDTVDEIKCMYTDVSRFEKPLPVHRAQAMCYAYIYALQKELPQIAIQLTYCDLDTEVIKRFHETFSFYELEEWFLDMMEAYRKWTDFQYEWRKLRQDSIHQLEFPFSYREGQRKLVTDVYRTILRQKILFIQAPTGTGKTISTLFPAVRAVGENLAEKIFYLTAKTITRTVAKETCDILKEHGYRGKVSVLTAKEKLCPCEEMDCNPGNCPRAKGHFDRVNDAVFDFITHTDDFSRDRILAQAKQYNVCPFEMALDAALYADIIICDYNYVFDPNVYLKRFFAEGEKGEYIFLIDEAHNLVERGREMYSAKLVKEDFLAMRKLVRGKNRKLESALEKCNRQMLEWKRSCEGYTVLESIGGFSFSLMRLMSILDVYLQSRGEMPERKALTEFYLNLRHFMNMMEQADDTYVIYTDFDEENRFCLHLYCVNPSRNLQACLDRGKSSIYFSATLLPVQYYKSLLSSKKDNYAVYAQSSFSPEQSYIFAASDVSSRYTRRNREEFARIAGYLQQVIRAKQGNYIAFFPSYRFMEEVYEQFLNLEGDADCVLQSTGMNEEERESFLSQFHAERERTLLGFCVLGGIFSEGIDLTGDRLIGVMVVGTGLPQVCNQREILKQYYQKENGQGFDYAYQFPGMNKVLQAAGRLIRTSQDRGVIALLDERFLRNDYRRLFPREWSGCERRTLAALPDVLRDFWEKQVN